MPENKNEGRALKTQITTKQAALQIREIDHITLQCHIPISPTIKN